MGSNDKDEFFNKHIKANPNDYPYLKIVEAGASPPPAPASDSALTKVDALTKEQLFIPSVIDPILEMIRAEVTKQASQPRHFHPREPESSRLHRLQGDEDEDLHRRQAERACRRRKEAPRRDRRGRAPGMEYPRRHRRRCPQTTYRVEQKDKDRIAKHEAGIMRLQELAKVPFGASADAIQGMIDAVGQIDTSTFDEFSSLAADTKTAPSKHSTRLSL